MKEFRITAQHTLGNKDKKIIRKQLPDVDFNPKNTYTVIKTTTTTVIAENNIPYLLTTKKDSYTYTIQAAQSKQAIKRVVLDEGARKPILSGADVMAPGIQKYKDQTSDFNKGDSVHIFIDNRCIAVGTALVDSAEINSHTQGPAITIIHTVSDAMSKYFKA